MATLHEMQKVARSGRFRQFVKCDSTLAGYAGSLRHLAANLNGDDEMPSTRSGFAKILARSGKLTPRTVDTYSLDCWRLQQVADGMDPAVLFAGRGVKKTVRGPLRSTRAPSGRLMATTTGEPRSAVFDDPHGKIQVTAPPVISRCSMDMLMLWLTNMVEEES